MGYGANIELLASATKVASGNAVIGNGTFARFRNGTFYLTVTAAATAAGDLLNVYIQTNVGSNALPEWSDLVSFTQVLGNGGTKKFVAKVSTDNSAFTATYEVPKDGTLAAASISSAPFSNMMRVKWVIVSASAPSFTFNVQGHFQE